MASRIVPSEIRGKISKRNPRGKQTKETSMETLTQMYNGYLNKKFFFYNFLHPCIKVFSYET